MSRPFVPCTSSVAAEAVARGEVRFAELRADGECLYWL
jgi:hypothetical protein